MVSTMSIGGASPFLLIRLGLAVVYLLLALALNPLLLEHELALPADSHHSESDFCAWLDHVAGISLQSALPTVSVAVVSARLDWPIQSPLRSFALLGESSRGPPVLI